MCIRDSGAPWPTTDWVKIDDWYYYAGGRIEPNAERIDVISKVCLLGSAGNAFQGKRYLIGFNFEAIQTTHEAVFEEWHVGYLNVGLFQGWYSVSKVGDIWTITDSQNDTYNWDPVTQTWSLSE